MSYKIIYKDFVKKYSEFYNIAEHYPNVLQKFKDGWDIKKISIYFKVPYHTIDRWVKRKTIPIPFLEYKKIKKEFSKKEINDLSLIIGHIFGDGGIRNSGEIHYCNSEKFLIKEFILNMDKIFNEIPYIKKEKKITRIRYSSRIGRTLWCIFGKFSYGKDTKTITPQIQKRSLDWKAKMLRVWFNDDGSVPKYGVIAIKQKLKPLIIFIGNILSELDIKSQISEDDGRWHLRICGYKNLVKFKEKIGFSKMYRKNQELNQLINKIGKPKSFTKDKIIELLKESPKTRKELSKSLNIKLETIYCHLHGWKRKDKNRKTNIGLIDMGLVKFKKKEGINIYSINKDLKGCEKTLSSTTGAVSGSC